MRHTCHRQLQLHKHPACSSHHVTSHLNSRQGTLALPVESDVSLSHLLLSQSGAACHGVAGQIHEKVSALPYCVCMRMTWPTSMQALLIIAGKAIAYGVQQQSLGATAIRPSFPMQYKLPQQHSFSLT